jgi:hypothetical protein
MERPIDTMMTAVQPRASTASAHVIPLSRPPRKAPPILCGRDAQKWGIPPPIVL